jgi:hypothetical protein
VVAFWLSQVSGAAVPRRQALLAACRSGVAGRYVG